ncbi:Mur ligase domain-containing protein [Kitasatospora sp. NPDC088346]|uniref:Mur ligase domain-containing protein n=1 Tax=Kitasatospora sp. NPDC088346 TaxID=3364073 RepID=UPI0037F2C0DB
MDTTTRPTTKAVPAVPELLSAPHLVDVAVPGMEGLARWLAGRGADVTGSVPPAAQDSPVVAGLRAAGVKVEVGFEAGHVRTDRTAVVWSGVVVGPHPELDRAQVLRLPVLGRALALAAVAAHPGHQVVAVGGSHSTATAAAALAAALDDGTTGWILNAASRAGSVGHASEGRLVVDFCPDTATHEATPPGAWQHRPAPHYLDKHPQLAIALITITGANAPHHADTIEGLNAAERLARTAATVVLPTWERGSKILRERLGDRPGPSVVTVGLDQDDDVRILVPRWTGDRYHVALQHQGEQHPFILPIAGRHHALAACAAIATALVLGEDPQAVAERLARFGGVERSLATVGTHSQITVVDSRARHPREVSGDVVAARMLTEGSVIAVLEPDGVARTAAHAAELGAALGNADRAVLLPVSTPLATLYADDPLDAVEQAARQALGTDAVHRIRSSPGEPCAEQQIAALTAPGDLVLVIGTDQAMRIGPRLLFHLAAPNAPIPHQL